MTNSGGPLYSGLWQIAVGLYISYNGTIAVYLYMISFNGTMLKMLWQGYNWAIAGYLQLSFTYIYGGNTYLSCAVKISMYCWNFNSWEHRHTAIMWSNLTWFYKKKNSSGATWSEDKNTNKRDTCIRSTGGATCCEKGPWPAQRSTNTVQGLK